MVLRASLLLLLCSLCHCAESFQIEARGETVYHGNGVAVSKNEILTCAHVLRDEGGKYRDAWVKIEGVFVPAEIIKKDKKLDLCVLRINATLKPSEFISVPTLWISGMLARAEEGKMVSRNISQSTQLTEITIKVGDNAQIGISGSPVFAEGRFVGIIKNIGIKESAGLGFVIPANVIEDFLRK